MDFSKRDIKMCEKAKEIQRNWKPSVGDIVFDREVGAVLVIIAVTPQCIYSRFSPDVSNPTSLDEGVIKIYIPVNPQRFILLPRQDQLQEMYLDFLKHNNGVFIPLTQRIELMINSFSNWCKFGQDLKGFNSVEQLWLAFVMWKKYGKIWDNEKEEWVKMESDNDN